MTAAAAPRLTTLAPSRTVCTDSNSQNDWILTIAHSFGSIATSVASGSLYVYDQSRLHRQAAFTATSTATALDYVNSNVLAAALRDGRLVIWDVRQPQPATVVQCSTSSSLQSLAVGYNGTLVAVGNDRGKIQFCDLRASAPAGMGKVLGTYGDSHSDVVTDLKFASRSSATLLSGSQDGLIGCFDTRQPTEEAALCSVMNAQSPVRRLGFCGDARLAKNGTPSTLFCLTGSETASLWDWEQSRCLQSYGGYQLRQKLTHTLTAAASISPPSASVSVDYLIDAHWDTTSRSLALAVGNNNGDGALLRLSNEAPDRWHACHFFRGGHRGAIRSWCPLATSIMGTTGGLSVTAGEDSNLVEWNHHTPVAAFPPGAMLMEDVSENSISSTETTASGTVRKAVSVVEPGAFKRHKVSTSTF